MALARQRVRIPGVAVPVSLRPDLTPHDVVQVLVELRDDVDAAKTTPGHEPPAAPKP